MKASKLSKVIIALLEETISKPSEGSERVFLLPGGGHVGFGVQDLESQVKSENQLCTRLST